MPLPLLVSNLTNVRYLSGISLTAGVMLLKGQKRLLFVDDRYLEKAKTEARKGIRVLHIDELKKTLKRSKRVRFEAEDVTVARLKRWKKRFRGTRFVPSENVVEEWRRQKKPEELRAIQKACRITDRVLQTVPSFLRVGAPRRGAPTEKRLAWEIEQMSRTLGVDAMAFETIVAFGQHTSRPHHRPTKRKLRRGDIVQIDMGVKVHGYCSDCSRVFFTGKPLDEQQQIFNLLVHVVKECTKRARAGTSNTALDRFARGLMRYAGKNELPRYRKTGYEKFFLHSLGHGVGLEIHEGLNLTSRKGAKRTKLLQNEVITIEPGVYFQGKWGMRIEDTVVVTRKGGQRLTRVRY